MLKFLQQTLPKIRRSSVWNIQFFSESQERGDWSINLELYACFANLSLIRWGIFLRLSSFIVGFPNLLLCNRVVPIQAFFQSKILIRHWTLNPEAWVETSIQPLSVYGRLYCILRPVHYGREDVSKSVTPCIWTYYVLVLYVASWIQSLEFKPQYNLWVYIIDCFAFCADYNMGEKMSPSHWDVMLEFQ